MNEGEIERQFIAFENNKLLDRFPCMKTES